MRRKALGLGAPLHCSLTPRPGQGAGDTVGSEAYVLPILLECEQQDAQLDWMVGREAGLCRTGKQSL